MIILAAIWGSGWVPSLLECTSMSEEVYENAWSTIVVSQWEGPASMTGAGFDAGFQYAITPGQRLYCYLHKLLWFSVGRQYSDRRDHAFSPLALVATYITPEAEITDWIVPDYRKPADTVLIDLCLLILRNIPSLSLLCWSQGFQDPEHDLPTWVPSFGKALSTTPLEKHNSKHKATEYFPLSLEQCPG